jgi:hypothetical protein
LLFNDPIRIGPERVAGYPNPKGTVTISCSIDGSYFAISSRSGLTRLYNSKELTIKGMAATKSPVAKIKFLDSLIAFCLDDG